MGVAPSKRQQYIPPQHGPHPGPFIPPGFAPPFPPPPVQPGWGQQPMMGPPAWGGPNAFPQPGMAMMQPFPSTRRRRRRRHSSREHSSSSHREEIVPRRAISTVRREHHDEPAPFIPSAGEGEGFVPPDVPRDVPRSTARRAATPAPPRQPIPEEDDSDELPDHIPNHQEPDPERILRPEEQGPPAAYGPTRRPQDYLPARNMPLRNPLPPPPRDLYEMSPYKHLLDLPQTAALLSKDLSQRDLHGADTKTRDVFGRKKSRKGGLFRSLIGGGRRGDESRQREMHFVPVFVDRDQQSGAGPSTTPAATAAAGVAVRRYRAASDALHVPQPTGVDPPMPQPEPAPASVVVPPVGSVPPVQFNHSGPSPFTSFMPHSPHRVNYENIVFPTATHLHESMKYLPGHPDLAQQICQVPDVGQVYTMSAGFVQYQRPDWNDVFLSKMEEALFLKFTQNTNIAVHLLGTKDAPLIYEDPNDSFWGSGPEGRGQNQLGQALMRTRERLIAAGHVR